MRMRKALKECLTGKLVRPVCWGTNRRRCDGDSDRWISHIRNAVESEGEFVEVLIGPSFTDQTHFPLKLSTVMELLGDWEVSV